MPSFLVASSDASLRSELRKLLSASTRLGSATVMEAGSPGEVTAALASGTLDVAVMDEAIFGGGSAPAPTRRTKHVVLSSRMRDSILREDGRTLLRNPVGLGRLAEEVERLLPGEVPTFDAGSELEQAFKALQRDYLSTLPERIASVRASLQQAKAGDKTAAEDARRVFHQIRGTGASFGMPELTDAAARGENGLVELAANPGASIWESVTNAADIMEALAARGVA